MTVGIVGLGLIGGSFAKAYHEAGATVLAWNRSRSVLDFAMMSGAVDGELAEDNVAACDLVLIALYPEATIAWFRRMAPHIGPHPVVLDCGGTKRTICAACFPIAKEHGVTFLGGHPMAGTQYSGFKNAKATMYHGAPMVIVPPDFDDVLLFDRVKQLLQPAGFSRFSFTTAEAHDARSLGCVYQEPYGLAAQGLFCRQLQGYDPRRMAEPRDVGRALSGKQGQSAP